MTDGVATNSDSSLSNSDLYKSTLSNASSTGVISPADTTTTDGKWLLHRSGVPSWARYTWITNGYRPIRASTLYCLSTIFSIHNETGNIWTHLGGAILIVALYANVYRLEMSGRKIARAHA